MKSTPLLLSLFLWLSYPASSNELQVIVSGTAIHVGTDELNEKNYGLGLQYDFDEYRRWIPVINLASFKDSNNQTSKYIAAGMKRRFRLNPAPDRLNFDVGVAGLVMTRKDYNNGNPFFGAIPFVSLSNDWGGINAIYVPKLEEDMYAFWYLQISYKIRTF